jgi:hypothetical protein
MAGVEAWVLYLTRADAPDGYLVSFDIRSNDLHSDPDPRNALKFTRIAAESQRTTLLAIRTADGKHLARNVSVRHALTL